MKRIFLFLLVFYMSCGIINNGKAQKFGLTPKEFKTVKKFEQAVLNHNADEVLALLHPEFKEIQLEEMFDNDVEAFLDNMFVGLPADNPEGRYKGVDFYDIEEITFLRAEPESDTSKVVYFLVKGKGTEIIFSISLMKYKDTYKFYGALG